MIIFDGVMILYWRGGGMLLQLNYERVRIADILYILKVCLDFQNLNKIAMGECSIIELSITNA